MCHEILYREDNINETSNNEGGAQVNRQDIVNNLNLAAVGAAVGAIGQDAVIVGAVNLNNLNNLSDSEGEDFLPPVQRRVSRETPVREEMNANLAPAVNQLNPNGPLLTIGSVAAAVALVEVQNNGIAAVADESSSEDDGYPLDEEDDDEGSSAFEVDTEDEDDDDHAGLQQNRGLVVFL
jgi:hypothetical protein